MPRSTFTVTPTRQQAACKGDCDWTSAHSYTPRPTPACRRQGRGRAPPTPSPPQACRPLPALGTQWHGNPRQSAPDHSSERDAQTQAGGRVRETASTHSKCHAEERDTTHRGRRADTLGQDMSASNIDRLVQRVVASAQGSGDRGVRGGRRCEWMGLGTCSFARGKGTQSLHPPRARLAVWVPQRTPREPLVQLMHHCGVAAHLCMGEVRGLRELHRTFWMGWALFTF